MPPSLNQSPSDQTPTPTPTDTSKIHSQPPKPRSNRNAKPKLSPAHFTNPLAISSALSIGRRYANRVDSQTHDPSTLLSSFLGRMSQWSSQLAPDLELPEFVVAAQALGGNRELKQFLANIRLAELRQVTDAWRTVQEQKREKKRRKRTVKIEEDDDDDGERPDQDTTKAPSSPPIGDQQGQSARTDDTNHQTSGEEYRTSLMKDPEVLARIERNRLMALEKRRAAQERKSAQEAPTMPVVDKQPIQSEKHDCMDIDPDDVMDAQEDVDFAVLDEMESPQVQIAQPQPCPTRLENNAVEAKKTLYTKQTAEKDDNASALQSAETVFCNNTKETGKESAASSSPTSGQPSQEKDDVNVPMVNVDNLITADNVVTTCKDASEAAIDDMKQSDALGLNTQTAPSQEKLHINPKHASGDSQHIPIKPGKAVSGEQKDPSDDGQPPSDEADMVVDDANKPAPAATTIAAPSMAPEKETEEDIDMDILQEFEAGAAEDY